MRRGRLSFRKSKARTRSSRGRSRKSPRWRSTIRPSASRAGSSKNSDAGAIVYDVAQAGAVTWTLQKLKELTHRTRVPAAFAMFPRDLSSPPREWAARFFDVQRWTEMPSGGHFAALEEPERLAEDLRAFFRQAQSGAS